MWRREGGLRKEEGLVGPKETQDATAVNKTGGDDVLQKIKSVEDAKMKISVSFSFHTQESYASN